MPLRYRSREELLVLFGGRRDVTTAKTRLLAADCKESSKESFKESSEESSEESSTGRGHLNNLLVKQEIEDYIKESDALALQGVANQSVEAPRPSPFCEDTNARIGALLMQCREAVGHGADMEAAARVQYTLLQGALYGTRKPPEPVELKHIEVQPETKSKPLSRPSICLLCNTTLANRSSLTRHMKGNHKELLSRQYCCPRCLSDINAGADKWCAHIEKCHHHETVAPNIPTAHVDPTRSLRSHSSLMDLSA